MSFKTRLLPKIYFTVTNDLSYDQRMIRICTSLANAGYKVVLVGRKIRNSLPLTARPYEQERLSCWFARGKLFYAEYNIRLFIFLLFRKMDGICSIDLDTILPCYYISKLKRIRRIHDAHEYFTQQKEIVSRPAIYKFWHRIEKKYLPCFPNGYTVSQSICDAFGKAYGLHYEVIRNVPLLKEQPAVLPSAKIILYQGAVNEARGFEQLIPAMKNVEAVLHIYGDGNFTDQAKALIRMYNLEDKVMLKGKLLPEELDAVTKTAYIGLNLVENTGLNQYFSLANKFFDLIHAGVPQVTMNFPEYRSINDRFHVALLIDDLTKSNIENAVNELLNNGPLHASLREHCIAAAKVLNWQQEETGLLSFYKKLFG